MPRVVITDAVADMQRWLEGRAERASAVAAFGTNVVDTVALDGSNQVAVTVDVSDLPGLQALLASPPPELAALKEKHGVIPPFTAYAEN